jgi:hypothetical protein
MTHNIIAGVDYGPLLAALRSHDSEGIDAAYADIQKQVYGRNAPVRHDPDGMGGDWPVPSTCTDCPWVLATEEEK